MEPTLKTLYFIKTKKQLVALYIDQLSEQEIRYKMNRIIEKLNENINCSNLTDKMVLIFINKVGVPRGYILSEELKIKLREI